VGPAIVDRDPGDETPERASLRDLHVVSWRFDQLEDAGYPVDIAVLLAERSDVDLHVACNLLERGATIHEALRILT
jgi:hypothetical protein